MTTKDYIAIADVLAAAMYPFDAAGPEREVAEGMRKTIAMGLCDVMVQDNPRFKKQAFLKACGVSLSVQ